MPRNTRLAAKAGGKSKAKRSIATVAIKQAFPGAQVSVQDGKVAVNNVLSAAGFATSAQRGSARNRALKQTFAMQKALISTAQAHPVETKFSEDQMWEGATSDAAYAESLTALKARIPGFAYAEIWSPSESGDFVGKSALLSSEIAETYAEAVQDHTHRVEHGTHMSEIANAARAGKTVVLKTVGKDQVYSKLTDAGFKTAAVVPIRHNGKIKAVFRIYSTSDNAFSEEDTDHVVNGVVAASMYSNTKHFNSLPFKQHHKHVDLETQKQVYLGLVANGVFPAGRAFAEVDNFFKMGFAPVYFKRFTPRVIANHIQAFIASKQFAEASANPEEVWLAIENNVKFMGGLPPEQSFHIVPNESRKIFAVERNIIRRINQIPANKNYSMEMSLSQDGVIPGSNKKAAMYVLHTHNYVNPANVGNESLTNLADICSESFMKHKTPLILDRYQEVVNDAANSLSPVAKVFPPHQDGSIPVMFAFKARDHSGPHSNYVLQLTQLLDNNKLRATRKFVETFANNVTVMSLYLDPHASANEAISKFTKQFSMMALVPQSDVLTPQFLTGALSAEEYTYMSAVSKVLYYVISSRPDEYNMLSKHLEKDTLNLGRLRSLYSSIRREAVSHSRIQKTMLKYPDLAKAIYQDFEQRTTTDQIQLGKIPINDALESKIKSVVQGNMELQIFQAMTTFNRSIPKTNFYRGEKSAISFRLEPEFFADMDLPRLPFGVFFVVGADFQGFHVRFADVSRGGIRLIQSRDEQVYNKNVATQFQENFNLAFTQNLKNKDIPEFGSKGTILLNPESQSQGVISFKRYVDSLLDLIVESNVPAGHPQHLVNNYGKSELLFLGPDEGTAGLMEYASLFAKKRGYSYWRSFTTGKPPSLGGIPHDTYGMTTNSVHRMVVGCIEKLGLKEEECTKIQTGGPDGDLGSNEILISKDKTVAVVDGSGVLYDPKGLNRTELSRLAHARVMGEQFDKAALSPEGFFVHVNDTNVVLPNGDKVESGIGFRNEFHLSKFATSDLFVPCGGRPESVNLSNVKRLFDPKTGKPKFKVIVEGANLFITQDARLVLEEAGVVLYKDASANKGGVTSSSLEVLAALSLDTETFEKEMAVHDPQNPPKAYQEYVQEIVKRIIADAGHEFDCVWREHLRTGLPRHQLTDKVSNKINQLNDFIHASDLWDNVQLREVVLKQLFPKRLQSLVGYDKLVATCPESYQKASFSAYLASRFVYKYGIDANEFAFYDFMTPFTQEALSLPSRK